MVNSSVYDPIFEAAGREWNVDPNLLKSVALQESSLNPRSHSGADAMGVMQIIPGTQRLLGVSDPWDPEQSIYGGAKYMSQALDSEKSVEDALRYYHGGPGWRGAYGPESQGYVPAVSARYRTVMASGGVGAPPAPNPGSPPVAAKPKAAPEDPDEAAGAAFLAGTDPAPAGRTAPARGADPTHPDEAAGAAFLGLLPAAAPPKESGTAPPPDRSGKLPGSWSGDVQADAEAARRIGSAALHGAREGWGEGPVGLGPTAVEALRRWGVYPPEPGGGTIYQAANEQILNPLAAGADVVLRGGNALFRGAQATVAQTGTEVGAPQLGRDLASFPEAFAGSPHMFSVGQQFGRVPAVRQEAPIANPLVGGSIASPALDAADAAALRMGYTRVVPGEAPPPGTGAVLTDKATGRQYVAAQTPAAAQPEAPASPAPEAPAAAAPGAPGAAAPGAPGVPGERRAVGADVSTDVGPEQTRGQQLRDLQTAVTQSAEDRAGPRMEDHTQYVPGVQRPLSARVFDPDTALTHKTSYETDPAYRTRSDKIDRENNDAMMEHYLNRAGDPIALEQADEARMALTPGKTGLFDNQQAVAPERVQEVVDLIDQTLAGPSGKRDAVVRMLENVRQKLVNGDGDLELMPDRLYGARKNITDKLKLKTGQEADDARLAKLELQNVMENLDPVIGEGAPGFQQYLADFHEASKPYNRMQFLQSFLSGPGKVTGVDGSLQLNRVQKVLDTIYKQRSEPGVNKAKALNAEDIQAIVDIRNELGAYSLRDKMGRVRGSDTAQKTNWLARMGGTPLGTAVKGAAEFALHMGIAASPASGVGNALYGAYRTIYRPAQEAARAQREAVSLAARKAQLLDTNVNPMALP